MRTEAVDLTGWPTTPDDVLQAAFVSESFVAFVDPVEHFDDLGLDQRATALLDRVDDVGLLAQARDRALAHLDVAGDDRTWRDQLQGALRLLTRAIEKGTGDAA